MSEFTKKCKLNPRYKKFIQQIEKGKYSVNITEYYNQTNNIHATRLIRRMQTKQVTGAVQKTLIDAMLQNQQYRSDIVTLRQECQKKCDLLYWHMEELSNYLRDLYPNSFKTLGNQGARDAAFGTLFTQANDIYNSMIGFISHADVIIADMDKAGWVLKGIVDVMNLNISRIPEL